jgi:hypothetical protein
MAKLIAALILSLAGVTATVGYFAPSSFFTSNLGHPGTIKGPGVRAMAPEIDPSSAIAALTLLLGGVTVLRSRVSKR